MIVTYYDMEDQADGFHGTAVHDSTQLRQLLQRLRRRPPFFCKLVGENGYCLTIGVGQVGCVQFSRNDGTPPYLMAVGSEKLLDDDEYEFLAGGTPTPVEARFCISFDKVIDVATHFSRSGAACPSIKWAEI